MQKTSELKLCLHLRDQPTHLSILGAGPVLHNSFNNMHEFKIDKETWKRKASLFAVKFYND